MKKTYTASAPGKILLIGGYSILEKGNPGYVIAITKRSRATITFPHPFSIHLPQFNPQDSNAFRFARTCIELARTVFPHPSSFSLTCVNDEGFTFEEGRVKSGFGSSAASTTAMSAVICKLHGITDIHTIHKFAQIAHAKAQGSIGSGFDVAAATFGTIVYQRYSPSLFTKNPSELLQHSWDYSIEPLPFPREWKLLMGFTRQSASTPALVQHVFNWKRHHPDAYTSHIAKMNATNVRAIDALRAYLTDKSPRAQTAFIDAVRKSRTLLRELGIMSGTPIEPPLHTTLIDRAERAGALVAKAPGAGGGDSLVALCEEDRVERVRAAWEREGLLVIEVEPTTVGLQWE